MIIFMHQHDAMGTVLIDTPGVQAKELCCVPSWQMTWQVISQSKCIPCENPLISMISMMFYDCVVNYLGRKITTNTFWPAQL